MKKHLFLLLAGVLTIGVSCSKLNQLEERLNDVDNRLKVVEATLSNVNVVGLKAAVEALQGNVSVSRVETTSDGYIIHFSDGTQAVLKNGTPGTNGTTPTIGVTEVDGVLVWTINGEPIKNNGAYVPVTSTPETPEFKFENDTWYFRIGNGEWQVAGSGSGCNCSIVETDDAVIITIGDTTVTIPKNNGPVTPTDLSKTGTANCYIVSKAGLYSIPAVKGNTSDSVGEVASAAVIWETVNTTTAEHYLICRVDNGINRERRDIAFDNLDSHAYILP